MSLLVRLYPASWRARYGDELETILEDDPPSPFDTLDLLMGAIDAHLHLRGLGRQSEHRKGITMTLRLAGSAAVIGGGLWIAMVAGLGYVSSSGTGGDGGSGAVLFAMTMAAQIALLVALAGLSAFQADRYPTLVWVAFLVPAAGAVVSMAGMAGMVMRPDEVIVAGMSGWSIWALGMMATIAGAAFFGAVTYLTGALSRTAAVVLTVGAVVALGSVGAEIVGGPIAIVGPLLLLLGSAVMGAGWIVLGLDALRRDTPVRADQPA